MTDAAALAEAAATTLAANWRGRHTVPSAQLYPHQWSWDSAFIAIGLASIAEQRARTELQSLFAAQWPDGRVPHIVFDPATAADAYFPGPRFWAGPAAPQLATTSGLVQPPVHARAVWAVARRSGEPESAQEFLRTMYPLLCRWHAYLSGHRDLGGAGLVAIVHPWESGMDNSPAWDRCVTAALARGAHTPRGRADLRHVPAGQRPGDGDYAAYIELAAGYRDRGYADTGLVGEHPFAVEDPLFNAVLAWSEEALAEIAVAVDEDPRPHRQRAARLGALIGQRLFEPALGLFVPFDVCAAARIPVASVGGLAALVSPGLPAATARRCRQVCFGPGFAGVAGGLLPSLDRGHACFDPQRYWRGPAWANTTWLVIEGLRRQAAHRPAADLRTALLEVVGRSGFREYFDADTGAGAGAHAFSWTAALTLDLLRPPLPPGRA